MNQDEVTAEVRQMLEAHLKWLRGWDERNNLKTTELSLEDYWLEVTPGIAEILPGTEVGTFTDGPRVMHDWADHNRRIIILKCTPFHDEGGAAILTGFFEMVYDEEPVNWRLCALVQEFDTVHSLLMTEGEVIWDADRS